MLEAAVGVVRSVCSDPVDCSLDSEARMTPQAERTLRVILLEEFSNSATSSGIPDKTVISSAGKQLFENPTLKASGYRETHFSEIKRKHASRHT